MRTPEQKAALRKAYGAYLRADHTLDLAIIHGRWDGRKVDRADIEAMEAAREIAYEAWRELQAQG